MSNAVDLLVDAECRRDTRGRARENHENFSELIRRRALRIVAGFTLNLFLIFLPSLPNVSHKHAKSFGDKLATMQPLPLHPRVLVRDTNLTRYFRWATIVYETTVSRAATYGAPSTRKVLKIVFPDCSTEWNTVQLSAEVHRSRGRWFPFRGEEERVLTSN